MPLTFTEYHGTIAALVATGLLVLLQLIVADVAAIRAKHKAGTPIPPDFSRFYFRAARAHANTNESVAAFITFATACMLLSANPALLSALSWSYVACRVAHMASYYANRKVPRSLAFGLSLVALTGMLALSIQALNA